MIRDWIGVGEEKRNPINVWIIIRKKVGKKMQQKHAIGDYNTLYNSTVTWKSDDKSHHT